MTGVTVVGDGGQPAKAAPAPNNNAAIAAAKAAAAERQAAAAAQAEEVERKRQAEEAERKRRLALVQQERDRRRHAEGLELLAKERCGYRRLLPARRAVLSRKAYHWLVTAGIRGQRAGESKAKAAGEGSPEEGDGAVACRSPAARERAG